MSTKSSPVAGGNAGDSQRNCGILCVQTGVIYKVVIQKLPESGCWKREQTPSTKGSSPRHRLCLMHLCTPCLRCPENEASTEGGGDGTQAPEDKAGNTVTQQVTSK